MEVFPVDVLTEIAKHLDADSFVFFGNTCKTLTQLLKDSTIWYHISCKFVSTQMNKKYFQINRSPYEIYEYIRRAGPRITSEQKILVKAINDGDQDAIQQFFEQGRNPSGGIERPLLICCEKGYTKLALQLLADSRVNPMGLGESPLSAASRHGHIDIVEILLGNPRVNLRNVMALTLAVQNNHLDVFQRLLRDPRADPNGGSFPPLIKACEEGKLTFVTLLLDDERTDPTIKNNGPLRNACEYGHIDIVRLLLKDKRVNPAVWGNRPLLEACKKRHFDIALLLLADPRTDLSQRCQICHPKHGKICFLNIFEYFIEADNTEVNEFLRKNTTYVPPHNPILFSPYNPHVDGYIIRHSMLGKRVDFGTKCIAK